MIKLMDILNEGGKLFGSRASRVTTGEMNSIFDELKRRLGDWFGKFELSKSLPSKQDHGDIDNVPEDELRKDTDTYIKSL